MYTMKKSVCNSRPKSRKRQSSSTESLSNGDICDVEYDKCNANGPILINGSRYQQIYKLFVGPHSATSEFVQLDLKDLYMKGKNDDFVSLIEMSPLELYVQVDEQGKISSNEAVIASNQYLDSTAKPTVTFNGDVKGTDSDNNKGVSDDSDYVINDSDEEINEDSDDSDHSTGYSVIKNTSSSDHPPTIKLIKKSLHKESKCTHKCEICHAEFKTVAALTKHARSCDAEKIVAKRTTRSSKCELFVPPLKQSCTKRRFCKLCRKDFGTASEFYAHLQSEHNSSTQPHVCDCCPQIFASRVELRQHLEAEHSNDRGYPCLRCGKRFLALRALRTHVKIHSGARPHSCDLCGKTFHKISGLKIHRRTHSGERPYACDFCGKTFAQSGVLLAHTKLVHTKEKPFVCDICGRAFLWLNKLRIHTRKHTGERPYKCPLCNKQFSRASGLRVHNRIHTGERPFTCDACDKNFVQLSALLVHKRTHTGERPFTCQLCPKTFTSMSGLQSHVRGKHTGERPFTCDVCNKAFIDRCGLKTHQNTHSAVKSFVCEMCGKAFSDNSHLRSHKRCHSDARPHVCDVCSVSFKDRQTLNKHKLRAHSSVKAYGCDVCDKHFADTSSLAQHKTRNHKVAKDVISDDANTAADKCDNQAHQSALIDSQPTENILDNSQTILPYQPNLSWSIPVLNTNTGFPLDAIMKTDEISPPHLLSFASTRYLTAESQRFVNSQNFGY